MSWNNTVRCSVCWETGHNKSSCSVQKERYERRKKENPDGWWVKNYEEQEARRKRRSCGYCSEEGHTKRTCKHIKADKDKTIQLNKEWRANALEYFKNLGLGVGSVVQFIYKRSWDEDQVDNVLISEVLWENLTFMVKNGSNPYTFRVRRLNSADKVRLVDFPIDPAGIVSPCETYGLTVKVLGPVSGRSIDANLPKDWLSGHGEAIDNMFLDGKGKTRKRYYIDWIEKD